MKIKTTCRIMTALVEDYTEDLNIKTFENQMVRPSGT